MSAELRQLSSVPVSTTVPALRSRRTSQMLSADTWHVSDPAGPGQDGGRAGHRRRQLGPRVASSSRGRGAAQLPQVLPLPVRAGDRPDGLLLHGVRGVPQGGPTAEPLVRDTQRGKSTGNAFKLEQSGGRTFVTLLMADQNNSHEIDTDKT